MGILDKKSLENAIEVQKRCYRFLQLLKNDQLDLFGNWAVGNTHDDSETLVDRFKEFLLANFGNIPEGSRPKSILDKDVNDFSNFFISYLFCSFDIVENSDSRLVQLDGLPSEISCWCELCTRLTDVPNLRLKKVKSRDKAIANSLEAFALNEIIKEQNIQITENEIEGVLENSELSEFRALIAYGLELVNRCDGEESDPSSLVLWRRFAWEKNGSPKKDFQLKVEKIIEAEEIIVSKLNQLAKN